MRRQNRRGPDGVSPDGASARHALAKSDFSPRKPRGTVSTKARGDREGGSRDTMCAPFRVQAGRREVGE